MEVSFHFQLLKPLARAKANAQSLICLLTQFGGWREMKTFPTENEDERALLGLEAWAMHEYYLKVEQGNHKVYLHFKVVKSINDS